MASINLYESRNGAFFTSSHRFPDIIIYNSINFDLENIDQAHDVKHSMATLDGQYQPLKLVVEHFTYTVFQLLNDFQKFELENILEFRCSMASVNRYKRCTSTLFASSHRFPDIKYYDSRNFYLQNIGQGHCTTFAMVLFDGQYPLYKKSYLSIFRQLLPFPDIKLFSEIF